MQRPPLAARVRVSPTSAIHLRSALCALCACGLSACTSGPVPSDSTTGSAASSATGRAVDPVGVVPTDLAIEVRVAPGQGIATRAKVEERPARFVLLADGSLHGETDRLPPDGVRPARVRRLAREQMADLWSVLTAAGFSEAARADTRGNVRLTEPRAGEILATLEVHANGERFAFVRTYRVDDDREAALRRVIRAMAALAWASDEALAESSELPTRYDAGSDPYARFAPAAGGEKR
jgi:hypothetical protein